MTTTSTPCSICKGRGVTWLEDDQGRPISEVTCEYCHGSKTDDWVETRAQDAAAQSLAKFNRRIIRALVVVAMAVVFALPIHIPLYDSSLGIFIRCWTFVFAAYYAVVLWRHRPVSKRRIRNARFTTDEQRQAMQLGTLGLVTALNWKRKYNNHKGR